MENKILLGKTGEWFYSEYYFDKERNCFIEEKYHHEYLDTGMVFDGSSIVSAQQVYAAFVENMNTQGIEVMLKCCDNVQPPQNSEIQITEQDFLKELAEIDELQRYRLRKIDSTYIFRNQRDSIIGVLSKTKYFYVYIDLYKQGKGFLSKNEAFVYILECLRETNSGSNIHTAKTEQLGQKKSPKIVRLKSIFKKK